MLNLTDASGRCRSHGYVEQKPQLYRGVSLQNQRGGQIQAMGQLEQGGASMVSVVFRLQERRPF